MRIALLVIVIVFTASFSSAQKKPNWSRTELQQIVDLENSVLLVPLLDEPKVEAISVKRNPELMRVREVNTAIIDAARNMKFTRTLFFNLVDSAAIYNGDFSENLFDASKQRVQTTRPKSEFFIAEFILPNFRAPNEIEVYNQRRIRRKEKKAKKHQDVIDDLQQQISLESDSAKVAEKIALSQWHEAKIFDIMFPEAANPDNDYKNNFWREKEYFHSGSTNHRRLLIRRLEGKKIVASKNLSYIINWNFVTRIHASTDERTKYREAFSYLDNSLADRKDELSRILRVESK